MAQSAYKIRDGGTAVSPGAPGLDAHDPTDARSAVSLHENFGSTERQAEGVAPLGGHKRIKTDDVIFFTTQLAVMVDTGVPLIDALDAIASQTSHPGLKRVLDEMCEDVRGGMEFSAALAKHPKVFNTLFVALMQASEMSGTMGQMLQRVSTYMEDQRETRKRIKGAMVYPLCMLSFCVVVVVCLLIFILPRFEKIYAGKSAALPAPTRALLAVSHTLTDYWPLVIGALAAAVVAAVMYFRSDNGRWVLDTIKIRMPVLGGMYRKACLARSLRCMATMVSTGVSMLEGLGITAQVAGNRHYGAIWDRVADGVKEGESVSEQLMDCPLMPGTLAQMIDAGERTGKLGMVMDRVARFCEEDLKTAVKAVTSMIEPLMIIIMGMIVGGIAMALLLPVFKLSKVVGR